MLVYVENIDKQPLMPTSPAKARILLKTGRAKVVHTTPFTIRLTYVVANHVQPLTHGVDTGSTTIGSAVSDNDGNVVYTAEVQLRNDIAKKMERRKEYRRNRRNRKTRYRKPKWAKLKARKDKDTGTWKKPGRPRKSWFSPTMVSKFHAHQKEIALVSSILPIAKLVLETGTFDPHALNNPAVLTNLTLYQQGINYGFANTKAYVLNRDNYTCQNCRGKSKDKRLDVHHIVFKTNGGSDEEKNLVVLCKTCHVDLHNGKFTLQLTGKKKGKLRHATQMNSIRVQLLKRLPEAEQTFGYITKEHRQRYGFEKSHAIDAVFIASQGQRPVFKADNVLLRKCVSAGDYQQSKGARSEKPIPTGKVMGFRKFDAVLYRGERYFVKGKFSTGYAYLMDITGERVDLKPIPKMEAMKRITARKLWITALKTITKA
jgi:hypothetical protein